MEYFQTLYYFPLVNNDFKFRNQLPHWKVFVQAISAKLSPNFAPVNLTPNIIAADAVKNERKTDTAHGTRWRLVQ